MDIKVKYIEHDGYTVDKLEKNPIGDWIDLRSAIEIEMKQGDYLPIPLGIAAEIPEGYEALIAPRSSTYKNFGLICANSVGIIDNSYRGEWHMVAIAMKDTTIHKGDRICQFRLIKNQPVMEMFTVTDLTDTARGSGGFGSTGLN